MFGDRGNRSVVIIAVVEVAIWCFLFGVRHLSGISVVWGGRVIDDMYINRMYTYRLSSDVMAIKVASTIMFMEVILFRISHFGINPESGGSPPSDRVVVSEIIIMCGELVHIVPMSLIVIEFVVFISKNIGIVAVM